MGKCITYAEAGIKKFKKKTVDNPSKDNEHTIMSGGDTYEHHSQSLAFA
jgi:hypothetical protein